MQVSKQVLAALAAVLVMAGCETVGSSGSGSTSSPPPKAAAPDEELVSGYTCCNIRYEPGRDWINELSYSAWPMIRLGTEAAVTGYGRYRFFAKIGGKDVRIGQDYTRDYMSTEEYAKRLIVKEDPKIKLATFPANIQAVIRAGKVAPGMTREQVIMAVGYPLAGENPDMDAPMWRMWVSTFGEYQLFWDSEGKIKSIMADPVTKSMATYIP